MIGLTMPVVGLVAWQERVAPCSGAKGKEPPDTEVEGYAEQQGDHRFRDPQLERGITLKVVAAQEEEQDER